MEDKNREVIIENSFEMNEESGNKKDMGISAFQSNTIIIKIIFNLQVKKMIQKKVNSQEINTT